MKEAWKLLKGNPVMRDKYGRAINHPAAMVYDDLARQINIKENTGPYSNSGSFDSRRPDDETEAYRMEQMQEPTHQREIMRRLEREIPTSFFEAKMAMRNDEDEKKRLEQYRQSARDRTSRIMDKPSHSHQHTMPTAGPNYKIQRQSAGTDVQMMPKKDFPFQYE